MKVVFKKITIANFKGIEYMTFDFGNVTKIEGANEAGKTTIADAIAYCLTGKNSLGEKQFEIVPVGMEGISPSVEISMELQDGDSCRPVDIKRVYQAKYNKEKQFQGTYSTVCYINGAKSTVKQLDEWVSFHICKSEIFRLVHDVRYFTENITTQGKELSWEAQRRLLMSNCGVESDSELASSNPKFASVSEALKRYFNVGEYMTALKYELSTIQSGIEKFNTTVDAMENCKSNCGYTVEQAEKMVEEAMLALKQLHDKNKEYCDSQSQEGVAELKKELETIEKSINDISQVNYENGKKFVEERAETQSKKNEYVSEMKRIEREAQLLVSEIKSLESSLKSVEEVCHSCGQPIPKDKVDTQKKDIQSKLDVLNKSLEEMRGKYKDARADRDNAEAELQAFETKQPTLLDTSELVRKREEVLSKIGSFEVKNLPGYEEEKEKLDEVYKSANNILSIAKNDEAIEKKILDEEAEQRQRIDRRSEVQENIETCREFVTYKCKYCEDKVNSLFDGVTFKMFRENKTNDEVRECCDIYYNGVPYASLSYSTKFIVSMKIALAFQSFYDVHIPVVVDNAESIDFDDSFDGQAILLYKQSQDCECGGTTGRRNADGMWTCQKCGKRFKKELKVSSM